jgi:hypothetical protein
MKRKTYIFCFVALIILFISAYFAGSYSVKKNNIKYNKVDSEVITNNIERKATGYWIRIKNGYIVIYNYNDEFIANTAISSEYLSEEERLILEDGVYVESAHELFRFLESYTS